MMMSKGAGVLFVRRSADRDLILLGKRCGADGECAWAIPGGELHEGEGYARGAFRSATACLHRFAGMSPLAPAKAAVCAGEVRVTCAAGTEWCTYIIDVGESLADWEPRWDDAFVCGEWFALDDLPDHLAPCVEGTLIEARRLGYFAAA